MEHDIDWNVKSFDDIDELNREFDNLRLGGLANLEELHQLLTKNKSLATANAWDVDTLLTKLEGVIEIVRQQI